MLLVLTFGGMVVRVPRFERVVSCLNEAAAAIDLLNGADTSRQLAKKHKVSEARLLKIYGTLVKNRKEMQAIKRKVSKFDDACTIDELFSHAILPDEGRPRRQG